MYYAHVGMPGMWRTIMSLSVFDLLKIGIGPSSSHTVGPMIAAVRFAHRLEQAELLPMVARVRIELYGSLGATGRGHGTDVAVLLGLCGHLPDVVDPRSEEHTSELQSLRRIS